MERFDTFELLDIFNEGMIGLFAYCSGYCVFLTKTLCAKTEKKKSLKMKICKFVQKTCTKNKISWVLLAKFMLTSLTLFCIMYYTIKPALIAD